MLLWEESYLASREQSSSFRTAKRAQATVHYRIGWLLLGVFFLVVACQPQAAPPLHKTEVPVLSSPIPFISTPSPVSEAALPSSPAPLREAAPPSSPTPSLLSNSTPLPSLPASVRDAPPPGSPPPLPQTTLLFTGVIVPARCVQAAIDMRGDSDYLFDEVRDSLSQADLAVGTLNATISDYPPHTGCIPTYVLVGGAQNADALAHAGFDLMSVATNHIKNCGLTNCGDRAFFDTLDNLRRVGILPIGAGKDLAEAMQPVVVEVNGVRFGFVSLGQLEPIAFASQDSPGIAVLNEENLHAAIAAARRVSDVVIAMPHWGPEEAPMPNWSQRQLARLAVEAGADLVVGNHTHVVQALEEINRVMVFYGLGNFVFDQDWARDHQQGVILKVLFEGKRFISYELIPTHVDGDGRVHIADAEEASEVLARIAEVSRSLP